MSDPLVDQSPAAGFQYSGEGTDVAELLAKADSAVQPGDIGTAAAEDVGSFATAAQGAKADLTTPLSAAAYGAR